MYVPMELAMNFNYGINLRKGVVCEVFRIFVLWLLQNPVVEIDNQMPWIYYW